MTTCTVDGCQKRHLAKGYCRAHYDQVRKGLTPGPSRWPPRKISLEAAYGFITRAMATQADECIDWPWAARESQYPLFNDNRSPVRVHRYVCELQNGPPPFEDAEAAHNCGRPCCINPRHIRWATHKSNMHDRFVHNTQPAKLDDAKVAVIRRAKHGECKVLARRFGISSSTASHVRTGKTWQHLPDAKPKRRA
jgi:hypothetical protein